MSDIEVRIRSIFDGAGLDAAQAKLQQFAQTSLNPQAFKQFSAGIAGIQQEFSQLALLDRNLAAPGFGLGRVATEAKTALMGMGLSAQQAGYAVNNLNMPTKKLVENLNVTERAAEKAGKAIGGFTGYLLRHVAYMGVFMAIYGLVNMFSEVSRNAMEEATALNKLDSVLGTVTSSHQLATAQVHDFAQSIALTTLTTQNEAIDAYQRFIALGASVAGAFDLVTSAVNLAAARNISLEFATEALARGMEGQYTRLTRLGVVTKDASGKALDFEQILAQLNEQFTGVAADQMEGYVGRLKIFSAALQEATEIVGDFWNQFKGQVATEFLAILNATGVLDFSGELTAYRAQLAELKQLREGGQNQWGVTIGETGPLAEALDKQIEDLQKIIDLYDQQGNLGEKNSAVAQRLVELELERKQVQEEINNLVRIEIALKAQREGAEPGSPEDLGNYLFGAPITMQERIDQIWHPEKAEEYARKLRDINELMADYARYAKSVNPPSWAEGPLSMPSDLGKPDVLFNEERIKANTELLTSQTKYFKTLLAIEEAEGDASGIAKRENALQGALQTLKLYYTELLRISPTDRELKQDLADVNLELEKMEANAKKVAAANAEAAAAYGVSHAESLEKRGLGTPEDTIANLNKHLNDTRTKLETVTDYSSEWYEILGEIDTLEDAIYDKQKGITDETARTNENLLGLVESHADYLVAKAKLGIGDQVAANAALIQSLTLEEQYYRNASAVAKTLEEQLSLLKQAEQVELRRLQIEYDVNAAKAARVKELQDTAKTAQEKYLATFAPPATEMTEEEKAAAEVNARIKERIVLYNEVQKAQRELLALQRADQEAYWATGVKQVPQDLSWMTQGKEIQKVLQQSVGTMFGSGAITINIDGTNLDPTDIAAAIEKRILEFSNVVSTGVNNIPL